MMEMAFSLSKDLFEKRDWPQIFELVGIDRANSIFNQAIGDERIKPNDWWSMGGELAKTLKSGVVVSDDGIEFQ